MPSPLLLHGFTGSGRAWPPEVIEGLAARGHAPLALDLPGHGADAGTTDRARFTLEAVFRRILGAAASAAPSGPSAACGAGIDPEAAPTTRAPPTPPPFDLLGYSMGGRIALAFALTHPDRVRRLVLESASPGLATEAERRARREADETLARLLEEEGIEAFVEHWEALPLFATQRRLPPPVREAQRARRLANDPRSLAAALRGLGTGALPSFWDDLPRLETPVLLLVGEEDPKFVDVARRMAARLPRARLHVAPGAGHNVHLERPEAWLEAAGAFLTTHPPAHSPPAT